MSVLRTSASVALVIALLAPLIGSSSVCGWDRTGGDRWTYDLDMVVEEVPVTGTICYDFIGREPAPYGICEDPVDVLRVSGHFEGELADTVVSATAAGALDGWSYRVSGSISTVMDELTIIANLTYTIGTVTTAVSVETSETAIFDPPLMSGFNEDSTTPGETWSETAEVERWSSFDDGSQSYEEGGTSEESYTFTVERVNEVKETPAGEFTCVMINMSYRFGYEIVWHCPDAGMPVMIERHDGESPAPYFTVVLSELSFERDRTDLLLLLIGLGVAASAFVLLVVVVMVIMRSRAAEVTGSNDGVRDSDGSGRENSSNVDDRTD